MAVPPQGGQNPAYRPSRHHPSSPGCPAPIVPPRPSETPPPPLEPPPPPLDKWGRWGQDAPKWLQVGCGGGTHSRGPPRRGYRCLLANTAIRSTARDESPSPCASGRSWTRGRWSLAGSTTALPSSPEPPGTISPPRWPRFRPGTRVRESSVVSSSAAPSRSSSSRCRPNNPSLQPRRPRGSRRSPRPRRRAGPSCRGSAGRSPRRPAGAGPSRSRSRHA